MSCKKPKFNICLLKQERFKSPTFNMGDLDLSDKTFVYKIKPKKAIGFKDYPTDIVDNLVYILPFDLPVGKYEHEFGFTDDKGYFVLFQGELEITNVASGKCTPCNTNISVNDCNEVFNISYSENVIEINGGGGSAELMIEITHADLLDLINSNGLTKGQQYRITDYVATVDTDIYNPDNVGFYARSNNHAFDIIVVADSENKLNENARAIRHNGDTYFPSNTKFEAWQLKYTIFNDSSRFSWALSNGKGVIYQLIDEWNNDLYYDFKSIQFQRNDNWVYTFGGDSDASLEIQNCYENKIKPAYDHNYVYSLNNNTFGGYCYANTLSYNCFFNTFGNGCCSNTFGDFCTSNTIGEECIFNTFGASCRSNEFGASCSSNTFGYSCTSNIFGVNCQLNIFGDNCYDNTLRDFCTSNTIGSDCGINTFGISCYLNTFENGCFNLTIGNNPPCKFKVCNSVSDVNLSQQILNFSTPPNGNTIEFYKTVNTIAFWQEVSAGLRESFDVV